MDSNDSGFEKLNSSILNKPLTIELENINTYYICNTIKHSVVREEEYFSVFLDGDYFYFEVRTNPKTGVKIENSILYVFKDGNFRTVMKYKSDNFTTNGSHKEMVNIIFKFYNKDGYIIYTTKPIIPKIKCKSSGEFEISGSIDKNYFQLIDKVKWCIGGTMKNC
tara:strand:+ start:28 stop:522 length:495 start_codon:yes stop_codon:yes gene_type:complete